MSECMSNACILSHKVPARLMNEVDLLPNICVCMNSVKEVISPARNRVRQGEVFILISFMLLVTEYSTHNQIKTCP